MKLTITKGLPASGKTTWAKKQNAHRINKDDLRAMLNNGIWSKHNEKHVIQVRDMLVRYFLMTDHDVIVDDTNLHPKHEQQLRTLVDDINDQGFNITFHIKDFTDVPLEECIKRDSKRPNYVGERVIRRMYNQFLAVEVEKPEYDPNKQDIILCDIDGTLAIMGDRSPYNDLEAYKDKPNLPVINLVKMHRDRGVRVVFLSGRKERSRDVTRKWMANHEIIREDEDIEFYMRPDDDESKDWKLKENIYYKHIRPRYNVLFILDDRNQVVEMWRRNGLTCLQVADGDF